MVQKIRLILIYVRLSLSRQPRTTCGFRLLLSYQLTACCYAVCHLAVQTASSRTIQIHQKGFLGIARYLGGKDELKLFAEHVICEFQHHVNHSLTAHEIMMRNGFQAGSVHFLVGDSSTKKAEQYLSVYHQSGSVLHERVRPAGRPSSFCLRLLLHYIQNRALAFARIYDFQYHLYHRCVYLQS